jgi:plastocyanin
MVPGQPYRPGMPPTATASSVAAKDNAFDPPTLTVQPGTTVRWENRGAHPHTVTSRDGKFDSGEIAPGSSYTYTFQTAGTYRYYCKLHKGMEGTIVVGEPKKMPGGGTGGTKGTGY